MTKTQYDRMVELHIDMLKEWLTTQPSNLFEDCYGSGRTFDSYFDEYNNDFAIVGYVAQDLQCPLADKMMKDYLKVPRDLAELMN